MGFSIYYMVTPRCILNCGYCFRDTSEESINSELDVKEVKKIVKHLYDNFNMRKLTISGGEPTVMNGVKNTAFLELVEFLKQFKSHNKKDNLRIELLSNAVNLTPDITEKLIGIIDRITITVDSLNEKTLTMLGRNVYSYKDYIKRFNERFIDFTNKGFELKLHSVVTPVNYDDLIPLARYIAANNDFHVSKWKFYQYMTYGMPDKDMIYTISDDKFERKSEEIKKIMQDYDIVLSFKDNKLMSDTMFNLLHNGRIEYYRNIDGKRVRFLSDIILNYRNWEELASKCNIDLEMIKKNHYEGE